MLKTFNFSKSKFFYYDNERQVIARFPSNSNLKPKGSDNSLYFGLTSNLENKKIILDFFNAKNIDQVNGLNYDMDCAGEYVNVVVNINAEGQIQIKITKDGTMHKIATNYAFKKIIDIDFTKMLIVVDFKNREIRFKDPLELII